MVMRSKSEGKSENNIQPWLKAWMWFLGACRMVYYYLKDQVRLVVFRLKQARAVRKGRREDTNRYPLW